ncbi:LamG-like jellyroll fold domain-containing protein [uncultured Polaribacter sp.]|uniref:LamG domain-containing protein n=1 Tax=uncultured Polaribacter sp. TaxID=174711 RepID=UPI00259B55E3|nr:LamG-like jellyroll fold domain-containing protein [uncultured Polaribacter sp.]
MSTEYFNDQWRIPNNKNQSLVSNYSMEFNGINDFVDISVASNDVVPSRVSDWTYSAWLYLDSTVTGSVPCIFERGLTYPGAGMIVGVKNTDKSIYVYTGGTTTTNFTSVTLPTDEWAYFALVYDVSTNGLTCYINNSSQTLTAPSSWSIGSTLFIIGKRQSNHSSYFWKGKMDQVSVFDYALPATGTNSVATLYGGGTAVTNPMSLSPKPISYYQLGDQSAYNGANYLVPNNSLQDYVFDFDSTNNEYIDCGGANDFSFTNGSGTDLPFSLSAWINMVDASSFRIISKYGSGTDIEWYFYTTGSDILRFRLYDKNNVGYIGRGYSTAMTSYQGQWINVVATYNGNEQSSGINIYINGLEVDDQDASGGTYEGMTTTTNPVTIGKMGTAYANGKFSNVSVFNTELSSTQVETIYNNGAPNDISSLSPVAWYKLNAADTFDGNDWTITDYGSGGNDGTSFGMDSSNLVQSDLQQTSGYSPYALDFDGVDDYLDFNNASANIMAGKNAISISGWFKLNSNSTSSAVFSNWYGSDVQYLLRYNSSSGLGIQWYLNSNAASTIIATNYVPNVGDWVHVVGVKDPITNGGQSRVYINGFEAGSQNSGNLSTPLANIIRDDQIGVFSSSSNRMNGSISNVAYWTDTALTQAQVTEIYNQGVPSNLNNFSGTAPAHWLQIGTNSSFNTNWTCLDEIGNINAVSAGGMTNDDITNGPGYSANGLGKSTIDIKGDAPYSSANGLSENMDVLDRATDVPS